MDDSSPMPIGMYKGKSLGEVPDEHLLWIWKTYKRTPNLKDLFEYLEDNIEIIQANVARNKAQNSEPYVYK